MTRYLPLFLLLLSFLTASAQKTSIKGKITDTDGEPLIGATVIVHGAGIGKVTDKAGNYVINDLRPGKYKLEASSLGYAKYIREVDIEKSVALKVDFKLKEDMTQLREILITEKSESTVLNESPIKITSIDTKVLKAEATNTIGILTRAAGVRVRQSGGLGSNAEIQLNGLTGNAVRQYYDGVPLELLGGGIQLNNLPVNAIDRIDVYKGVMPIDIGTDALAGGINVVPKEIDVSYLDASYEIGSFNTHVVALNGAKVSDNGLFIAFNGFFNYSDNDYEMQDIEVHRSELVVFPNGSQAIDIEESIENVTRFHNQHQSSFAELQIGKNNLPWADKIALSTGFSQRFDEVQHGVIVGPRPFGEFEVGNKAFFQNLKYQKNFNDKLTLRYFGNYAIIQQDINDSTQNLYNWSGEAETLEVLGKGAELLPNPSLRKGRTFTTVHRLSGSYDFWNNYQLSLSNFFAYQRITGNDSEARMVPLQNPTVDPNTLPSSLRRNIAAAQLSGNWLENRLEAMVFGKYYSFNNTSSDFEQAGETVIFDPITQSDDQFGFGSGLKLSLDEDRFLRVSYERAVRIPSGAEVFGDFIAIGPNFNLRPEISNNLNVGFFYKYNFSSERFVSLQLDWFLRDQTDLIFLEVSGNPAAQARFINLNQVEANGVEFTLKTAPLKNLNLDLSFTSQDIINAEEANASNSNGAGVSLPNRPLLFYNLGLRYSFDNPFRSEDKFTFFSYYNYVSEFSFIQQGRIQNDDFLIPTQTQMDAGISYKLADSGVTFSLQINNVTNAEVFDNFRIPRPGRNFRFKIRYLLH